MTLNNLLIQIKCLIFLTVYTVYPAPQYTLFMSFCDFAAGLSVGICGLGAGFAIGIVGDAGNRQSDICSTNKSHKVLNEVLQLQLLLTLSGSLVHYITNNLNCDMSIRLENNIIRSCIPSFTNFQNFVQHRQSTKRMEAGKCRSYSQKRKQG